MRCVTSEIRLQHVTGFLMRLRRLRENLAGGFGLENIFHSISRLSPKPSTLHALPTDSRCLTLSPALSVGLTLLYFAKYFREKEVAPLLFCLQLRATHAHTLFHIYSNKNVQNLLAP